MEGFTYVDIFATKGIEYLLVIGFLFAFVLYWRYLTMPAARRKATAAPQFISQSLSDWFRIPADLYYHPAHTWAMKDSEDIVRVGIDDFANKLIGDFKSINLPPPGTMLLQGESAVRIRSDGKEIPIISPVNGEVVELNDKVLKNPEIVSRDPYGEGWLVKIKNPGLKRDMRNLLSGKIARAWMDVTIDRLRELMSGTPEPIYQDGGAPLSGIARAIAGEEWDRIAMEFLLP